jgi:RNA polymerase sigma-70 factor, ECF subfamily
MIAEIARIAKVTNWLVPPHKTGPAARPSVDAMPERSPNDHTSLVGQLYDEHGPALYRYALMLLADRAGAEDAVQQVFASLLRGGSVTSIASDSRYLRRGVRNACYSLLRKRVTRAEVADGAPLLELATSEDAPPDERLAIEGALRALTVEQREVVHLHVFEGLTFQEVADAVGASINTVASRSGHATAAQ